MSRARRAVTPVAEFLHTEAGGGAVLLAATVVALIWANSPWSQSYQDLWHTKLTIGSGGWGIREDLQHWVNDALTERGPTVALLDRTPRATGVDSPANRTLRRFASVTIAALSQLPGGDGFHHLLQAERAHVDENRGVERRRNNK